MPALGNSPAVQHGLRQPVTFDDRHPLVGVGQDPGREQAAHAGTQHHRMVTNLRHLPSAADSGGQFGIGGVVGVHRKCLRS